MKKLYRIISAILINEQNNTVLLVRNSDEHSNNLWSFPGGQIEKGETLKSALKREVKEETGLAINNPKLAYVTENFVEKFNAHSLVTYFSSTNFEGDIYINDPDKEITEVKWIKISEVEKYITNQDIVEPFNQYMNDNKTHYYFFENMKWG